MHLNKSLIILLLFFLLSAKSQAQTKWIIENYNYIGQPGTGTVVPMLHFETPKNWYAELRYNYEEVKTISFFGGKTFNIGKIFSNKVTPLIGFSAGNFTGVSAGLNTESEWKNFYMSTQSQYSVSYGGNSNNFFFSWSEIGHSILQDRFFAGVAVQYTWQSEYRKLEPGFVTGLELGNFSFPVYVFSPFQKERYFIIGVNYEYKVKNKRKH